jgi:hypothetical protein
LKHFLIGGAAGFVIVLLMWQACRISFAIGFAQGYRSGETNYAAGFVEGYLSGEAGCLDQAQPNAQSCPRISRAGILPLATADDRAGGGANNKSQLRPTVQRPLILPIRW